MLPSWESRCGIAVRPHVAVTGRSEIRVVFGGNRELQENQVHHKAGADKHSEEKRWAMDLRVHAS